MTPEPESKKEQREDPLNYKILDVLASHNGYMEIIDLLSALPKKDCTYVRRLISAMCDAGFVSQPMGRNDPVSLTGSGYMLHALLTTSKHQQEQYREDEAAKRSEETADRRRERQIMLLSALIGAGSALFASVLTALAEYWVPPLILFFNNLFNSLFKG